MNRIKLVSTLVLTSFLAVCVTSAFATESKWEKKHPRRDQVNDRLANQNKRIHNEVKEGEISKSQAAALHKDDHQIRFRVLVVITPCLLLFFVKKCPG